MERCRLPLEERLKAWLPPALYLGHKVRKDRRAKEPELGLLQALVGPYQVALDVGANRGVYSFVLARHAREVHAFEPHPLVAGLAARLLRGRATVHRCALSDRNGARTLYVPEGSRGEDFHLVGSLEAIPPDAPGRAIDVEGRTLDSFGFEGVGFVKIDVEGHEPAVLAGARGTIERNRPNLLAEFLGGHYEDPQGVVDSICREYDYLALVLAGGILRSFASFARDHDLVATRGENPFTRNVLFLPR